MKSLLQISFCCAAILLTSSCKIQKDDLSSQSLIKSLKSLEDLCSEKNTVATLTEIEKDQNKKNDYIYEYLKYVEKGSVMIALEQYFLSDPVYQDKAQIRRSDLVDAFSVKAPRLAEMIITSTDFNLKLLSRRNYTDLCETTKPEQDSCHNILHIFEGIREFSIRWERKQYYTVENSNYKCSSAMSLDRMRQIPDVERMQVADALETMFDKFITERSRPKWYRFFSGPNITNEFARNKTIAGRSLTDAYDKWYTGSLPKSEYDKIVAGQCLVQKQDGVGVNEYKFRWAPFGVKMTVGVVGGLLAGAVGSLGGPGGVVAADVAFETAFFMEAARPTIEQLQALESLEWVQTYWHNMASEGCMVESKFGAIRDQLRRELLGDFIGMTVGISSSVLVGAAPIVSELFKKSNLVFSKTAAGRWITNINIAGQIKKLPVIGPRKLNEILLTMSDQFPALKGAITYLRRALASVYGNADKEVKESLAKNTNKFCLAGPACEAAENVLPASKYSMEYANARISRPLIFAPTPLSIQQSFEIASRKMTNSLNEKFLLKLIKKSQESGALPKKSKIVEMKEMRTNIKGMAFTFQAFDAKHAYPKHIKKLSTIMGHIQDAFTEKNTSVYLSEIGKLSEFMKKHGVASMKKDAGKFVPTSPEAHKKWIADQIGSLRRGLDNTSLKAPEYHSMRKVISSLVMITDNYYQQALAKGMASQADHYDEVLKVLSTLNKKMGDYHDVLTAARVAGKEYENAPAVIANDIRSMLEHLLSNLKVS